MARNPTVDHLRAVVANAVLRGDTDAAAQARRALGLARTENTIRKAIENAPPLDAATLARIRALIPPVGAS